MRGVSFFLFWHLNFYFCKLWRSLTLNEWQCTHLKNNQWPWHFSDYYLDNLPTAMTPVDPNDQSAYLPCHSLIGNHHIASILKKNVACVDIFYLFFKCISLDTIFLYFSILFCSYFLNFSIFSFRKNYKIVSTVDNVDFYLTDKR